VDGVNHRASSLSERDLKAQHPIVAHDPDLDSSRRACRLVGAVGRDRSVADTVGILEPRDDPSSEIVEVFAIHRLAAYGNIESNPSAQASSGPSGDAPHGASTRPLRDPPIQSPLGRATGTSNGCQQVSVVPTGLREPARCGTLCACRPKADPADQYQRTRRPIGDLLRAWQSDRRRLQRESHRGSSSFPP